jgi:hypothetical protein
MILRIPKAKWSDMLAFVLSLEPLQPNTQPRPKKFVGHEKKSYIQVSSLLVCPCYVCARAVREKKKQTMLLYCLQ